MILSVCGMIVRDFRGVMRFYEVVVRFCGSENF